MSDDVRHMYIDGKWVLAEGGATFDVINPADQSVVGSVANGATPEILRAVEAAQGAFKEWSLLADFPAVLTARSGRATQRAKTQEGPKEGWVCLYMSFSAPSATEKCP